MNVPSLAMEASGPQLICAYSCYAAVFGTDGIVPSSSQGMGMEHSDIVVAVVALESSHCIGGESCLHCELSSVEWESSAWPDIISYSGSVHNIVLYVSTTGECIATPILSALFKLMVCCVCCPDDLETRVSYVPLVCGPLATDKIYDGGLLREKMRHDPSKSKLNIVEQDPVLLFRTQIPIHVENFGS